MTLCLRCHKREAIPCIKGWTDSDGEIIIENCSECEKEIHHYEKYEN